MANVFQIQDTRLIEASELSYDSEEELQALIAQWPILLRAEDDVENANASLLLIGREIPIGDSEGGPRRWSADHLFVDENGIPVLVEVKRSSDTRIRREVVGQMLEYATNICAHLRAKDLRHIFTTRCAREEANVRILESFISKWGSEESFWDAVEKNLLDGQLKLIFVADEIPDELALMIEFLNRQMLGIEAYGIQVKRFIRDNLITIVSEVVGKTAETTAQRAARLGPPRSGLMEALDAFKSCTRDWEYAVSGTKPDYRQIRLPGCPAKIHYEFLHRGGQVTAELHIESPGFPRVSQALASIAEHLRDLPNAQVSYEPNWYQGGRLRAFPHDTDPMTAAKAMKALIEATRTEILRALNE